MVSPSHTFITGPRASNKNERIAKKESFAVILSYLKYLNDRFPLPFHIPQLVRSLPTYIPEDLKPAWKVYSFRAEPTCIVHNKKYSSPPPPTLWTPNCFFRVHREGDVYVMVLVRSILDNKNKRKTIKESKKGHEQYWTFNPNAWQSQPNFFYRCCEKLDLLNTSYKEEPKRREIEKSWHDSDLPLWSHSMRNFST